MKKSVSFFLSFILLLSLFGAGSGASAQETSPDIWEIRYYEDHFGDPTEEYYLVNAQPFTGTFYSETAKNAPLRAELAVDLQSICVVLFENENAVVRNTTGQDVSYTVTVITAGGDTFSGEGILRSGEDRIELGGEGREFILNALSAEEGSLSFYLEHGRNRLIHYLFEAESGNFAQLYYREIAPALIIGDRRYSPAELSLRYANEYYTFVNSYGSYVSLFGLDTSLGISGLDSQSCSFTQGGTWRDYFLQRAQDGLQQIQALTDYGRAHGIALNEEEIAEIDANTAQTGEYAAAFGYSDPDSFLSDFYGSGVTTGLFRQASLDSALAAKVSNEVYAGLRYTADELEAEYRSFGGEQDIFSFMVCDIPGAADEAHAAAEAVCTVYAEGTDSGDIAERFGAAVASRFPGEVPATRSGVRGSALDAVCKEWLMDAGRRAGDAAVFDGENGSQVLVFLSRDDNHYPTAMVRHILVKVESSADGSYSDKAKAAAKARAEELLAEFLAGDGSEESFAAMASLYSEDTGSRDRGGLYENVYKGQMVKEFDAFLFEGHKPGDTGLVYGENSNYAGYHVMYYAGEGELYSSMLAEDSLRSRDMEEWMAEITAPCTVTAGLSLDRVG